MKILALSDTHGLDDFSYLVDAASEADFLLVAGDISMFGMGIEEALNGLSELHELTGKSIIITHGNHEWSGLDQFSDSYPDLVFVDRGVYEFGDIRVVGYGGGGFGQFDNEFESFIPQIYQSAPKKFDIWLMHGPPHDMEIDVREDWGPTGCLSRRKMILEYKPNLVVAGHIHEAAGIVTDHDGVILCNPGPAGMVLDLTQEDS